MINENTPAPRSDEGTAASSANPPLAEAKENRAAERLIEEGKATSPEREAMYGDDTLAPPGSVGESGTQGAMPGHEDQNPIGKRSA